jgi:plasmid stabilization system protein ParE
MKLRYTDRARDDIELSFVWYERQRRGLGFEFLDCVELAIKSIIDNPDLYRGIGDRPRFPYIMGMGIMGRVSCRSKSVHD